MLTAEAIDCSYSVAGEGPPLFLIHGIGAARNTWAKLMPLLTSHYTVVTYDLRGHGISPLPDGEFGLNELVADMEAIRIKTGFEKAHVAGHSLGGMIGPAYAYAFPDRVLSLGLLSPPPNKKTAKKCWRWLTQWRTAASPMLLETLTNRWFTDVFIKTHGDVVRQRLDQVISTDPDVFLNVFQNLFYHEMAPWLHDVTAPSLVLTNVKMMMVVTQG